MNLATTEDIKRVEAKLDRLLSLSKADPEEVMTTDQAAAFVKVDRMTLYKWRCGKTYKNPLPCYGTGKSIRYLKSDLIKFLKNHPVTSDAA